jgi:uncharacterized protein
MRSEQFLPHLQCGKGRSSDQTFHLWLLSNRGPLKQAFEIVEQWLSRPNAVIIEPTANFMTLFQKTATDGQAGGALLMDAHLAALVIEHGASLATLDRDFSRFDGLKIEKPF